VQTYAKKGSQKTASKKSSEPPGLLSTKQHLCRYLWNGLPDYLKSPDLPFDFFKRQLKTVLFCVY